jgi:hypothetical protein
MQCHRNLAFALSLAVTAFCNVATASQLPEPVGVSSTVEGQCKPSALDENGKWDCRLSKAHPTCTQNPSGEVSIEIRDLVAAGEPLSSLDKLIQEKFKTAGISETIAWLACQGFSVHGDGEGYQETESRVTLARLAILVTMAEYSRGELERTLLSWKEVKAERCFLWVVCINRNPIYLHIVIRFDKSGQILSFKSNIATEGM